MAESLDQILAAAAALDGFARTAKDAFNLLVELIAIGDDHHACVGVVGKDPAGEQHHHDAFATALGVPDDAATPLSYMLLGSLDAEVLMDPWQLFDATIKQYEVAQEFDQSVLATDLDQVFVELEAAVIGFIFLPAEEVLLWRLDGPVAQPFRIVASQHELIGGEEPGVEFRLLIGQVLADAITNAHAAALEFDNADRDAVHIQRQTGPPLLIPFEGDLLSYGEVVGFWIVSVDECHGAGGLIGGGLHLHAVAQQGVDTAIGFIEAGLADIRGTS